MKNNIRVMHIGPHIQARGGIASVLYNLQRHSTAFAQLGFNFDFLATTTRTSPRSLDKARAFAKALFCLLHKLIRSDVDIVHIHTALRGSLIRKSVFALACLCFRTPYVFHIHNGAFVRTYRTWSALGRYCVRLVLRQAAGVIILSRHSWQTMTESKIVSPGKCHVLFNGIEDPLKGIRQKRAGTDRPVIVTFLGLISPEKGVPVLISAIAGMRSDLPPFSVRLGGIGAVEDLQDAIKTNGIDGIVRYVGWLEGADKAATLAATDIFVLPSRSEGFSVAILEAMAYGLAVVSTSIPGVVDAIRPDIDGVLIEPDDVAALTASLERLIADPFERKRLGESARQRYLDTFTIETMAADLAGIYIAVRSQSGKSDSIFCGKS